MRNNQKQRGLKGNSAPHLPLALRWDSELSSDVCASHPIFQRRALAHASLQRSAALRAPRLLNLRVAPPSSVMSARGREVGSIEELSSYNTTETSTA